jgi:hypothetical protein
MCRGSAARGARARLKDNGAFDPSERFMSTRFSKFGLLCVGALALNACTPSFDWRTVVNQEGGYEVMFPGKPGLDQRSVRMAGTELSMQIQSARVGDVSFAVGVVTLPADDPALRATVLAALEEGLAHNIGATPATQAVAIETGDPAQRLAGAEFVASGTVPDAHHTHRVMHARFVARGTHVYEAVVVAPKEPPVEQVDPFFGSWRLL